MATPKEQVRSLLDTLSDDASLEDIQHQIYVNQKIDRGLDDAREGRVLSQAEVERRMQRWLKP